MNYPKLFEEGRIGSLHLKNRGIMMPMATDMADKDGMPTPRQIAYYKERAKGGLAMIINEYTGVDDIDSIPSIHNLRAARDYQISALEELTDAVHLYDCKIIAQIHHGGATSNPLFTGRENLAPSQVPIVDGRPVPREMTLEDIARIEAKFVDAAVRCKKAGYDGVELHGAHGYLIAQFFSKYYNRREDQYGGSVENRCRFVKEIIEGIRSKLGNFPILLRMCGDEMTPVDGFLTLEDGLEIAKYLETLGIDALNISMGSARNGDANCEPFSYEPGWKKHVAKRYREELSIPIIATNTIKDPDFAESLLEEGVCDFVGLGRSQLADPDFMKKASRGEAQTIRKCIGCLYCRERVLGGGLPIRCAVNPRTAREIDFPVPPKDGAGKTVCVIGAGPAGIEAALTLTERDFHVVLLEKESSFGGTLNIADKPPLKDKITHLTQSLQAQIESKNVEVHLGVTATPELLATYNPSAVIVASGARPVIPSLPGIDPTSKSGNYGTGLPVYAAEDVLTEKTDLTACTAKKLVVVGSGLTGLETAELLLSLGHKVSIVEMLSDIGPGIFPAIRNDELSRITPYEPPLYPGHKLLSIDQGGVQIEQVGSGSIRYLQADAVILALGIAPKKVENEDFRKTYPDAVFVGDARQGGRIASAVRQGFEAAYTLHVE